jgi:hypothetical protein
MSNRSDTDGNKKKLPISNYLIIIIVVIIIIIRIYFKQIYRLLHMIYLLTITNNHAHSGGKLPMRVLNPRPLDYHAATRGRREWLKNGGVERPKNEFCLCTLISNSI